MTTQGKHFQAQLPVQTSDAASENCRAISRLWTIDNAMGFGNETDLYVFNHLQQLLNSKVETVISHLPLTTPPPPSHTHPPTHSHTHPHTHTPTHTPHTHTPKVNLNRPCPFWPDDGQCVLKSCHVEKCTEVRFMTLLRNLLGTSGQT